MNALAALNALNLFAGVTEPLPEGPDEPPPMDDRLTDYLAAHDVRIECSVYNFLQMRMDYLQIEHNAGTGRTYFKLGDRIVAMANLIYGDL